MHSKQADIIIIGGGVIGLSIAYFTAAQGASVILIEKNRIPTGSSYGNAGLIVPSHCDPLAAPGVIAEGIRQIFDPSGAFSIRFRPDPALALWLLKFSRFCNEKHFFRAVEIFKHLCRESSQLHADFAVKGGSHYEYEQSGLLHLFASHEVFRESREMAEKMANYGIEFSALSGDEARELDPAIGTRIVGAIRHTTDARLYPPAFLNWLAKETIQKGAQILTETDVIGFEKNRQWVGKIHTTRGELRGDQIVIAAGAWTPLISKKLGIHLPVQAAKGYSLMSLRPQGSPRIPVILREAHIAMTPYKDRFRISGVLELSGLDWSINLRRLNAIQRHARLYFPEIKEMKLLEIWRGFRPCTPDGLPMIGRAEPFTNLWIATGHATKGMTLGPVTGKLMSDLLNGKSIGSLSLDLRVHRFK